MHNDYTCQRCGTETIRVEVVMFFGVHNSVICPSCRNAIESKILESEHAEKHRQKTAYANFLIGRNGTQDFPSLSEWATLARMESDLDREAFALMTELTKPIGGES